MNPFSGLSETLYISFLRLCNKVLQTGRLKTTEVNFFIVLETRSPKLRCQKGHVAFEGSREESTPPPAYLLSSFCGHQEFSAFLVLKGYHSSLSLCPHVVFSCVGLYLGPNVPLLFCKKTSGLEVISLSQIYCYGNSIWNIILICKTTELN